MSRFLRQKSGHRALSVLVVAAIAVPMSIGATIVNSPGHMHAVSHGSAAHGSAHYSAGDWPWSPSNVSSI
jgi:hypothetical protein